MNGPIPVDLKGFKDEKLDLVLPPFLKVERRPFDPVNFEKEKIDSAAAAIAHVENTLRWKNDYDVSGNVRVVTNAKIVKWQNKTMSLFIGNKVFDIKKVDAQPGSSSAADNERYVVGLFPNYEDSQRNLPLDSHPGNPLNAQPKKEEDVVVDEPTKSVEMLKEKIQKKQKMEEEKAKEKKEVKVIPATKINPEHERTAKIRLEEERLRALQRRESRKKRGGYERPVSMSQAFLESENSGDDLAAIKDRYKYGKFDLIGASSSEESSGDERRLDRAKRSDSEDSDVETRDKAQTKKKIVEDEDSD